MKTEKISPNAYKVTAFGLCNCYLVREEHGFTLVDTTLPGQAEHILSAARALGADVRRILLTHAHSDHIGSLDKLVQLLGKVHVAISLREAPMLHKDLSLKPNEPQHKMKGGFPGAKTQPTHTLSEGELFGSLRCFYTPGHTPGHMSFLDERDGILYTGDAMQSIGGLSTPVDTPWYFPLPKMATWDQKLALQSARKLATLPVQGIATGHGRFTPAISTTLQQVVAKAERK